MPPQITCASALPGEMGKREWTVLHAQCTTALSSGFPILQGNAEALDR